MKESPFGMRKLILAFIIGYCFLAIGCDCTPICDAEERFVYKSHGRRDPMIPLVTPQGLIRDAKSLDSDSGFILEGIVDDGKSVFAIINGEIVEKGEIIGNAKVTDILKDKILILIDGQTQEIWLEDKEGE